MAAAMRAVAVAVAVAIGVPGIGPAPTPVHAQGQALPIIRDTEIENLLRDYATPILRAAGLAKQNIKVVVLNDRTFNAFVMDGRHIFINAGALFDAKTPNEVIGVLAHETGHLAGGHLQRLREQLASAQTASIIALLAGIGVAVAGARAGSGGGDVLGPAIMAPQTAIQRSLLSYVRTQEDQADHAGVKFLNATHQSPRGMVDLFKRLADESLYQSRFVDPYLQTHPMPAERVATLQQIAKASPYWDKKDSPELQLRHDMMRAKLSGFLEEPGTVAHITVPCFSRAAALPGRIAGPSRTPSMLYTVNLSRATCMSEGTMPCSAARRRKARSRGEPEGAPIHGIPFSSARSSGSCHVAGRTSR